MGFLEWSWRNFTPEGHAQQALERGDLHFHTTLDYRDPNHVQTVERIRALGWRIDRRVLHKQVKTTDVQPQSDGTHRVTRSYTQQITFYFARIGHVGSSSVTSYGGPAVASYPTWPGWYPSDHGFRWWDGNHWGPYQGTPTYAADPPAPTRTGLSSHEHTVHLILTVMTCGLWSPVWIVRALSR